MDLELLRERACIIQSVRSFFARKNYLETDTPLLSPDLIPESCLEVFETMRIWPHGSKNEAKKYWLIPSPEIWMKKLISKHKTNIYQICKCFRNGESSGFLHSPEFTMLEYYTMNADYLDSIKVTEEMFSFLLAGLSVTLPELEPPFERITYNEAFIRYAGFDLLETAAIKEKLQKEAQRLGLDPPIETAIPELTDLIFIHAVEPNLPRNKPVVLIDYPAFIPCLAKKSLSGLTTERWELYINGIELANCYSEETDPQEVRRFFEKEKSAKEKNSLVNHNIDPEYWKIFDSFPVSSGVALGLDRLIMALTGRKSIDAVLPLLLNK